MSLIEDTEKIEEELFNKFQDTLDNFYEWEEKTRQEFLSTIYPNTVEEE